MRIRFQLRRREKATALLVVMGLGAVSLLVLASTMQWTSGTANITDGAIHHSLAVNAAEAATEKAISKMSVDFATQNAATVSANVNSYRALIPTSSEDGYWSNYLFSDGSGNSNRLAVGTLANWATNTPLISQYQGLNGYAATYRIKANATDLSGNRPITGAVQQDVQLALIPIFQFAIFYNLDMEVNPGAPMTIGGRTHGNENIYLDVPSTLTFAGDVTSAGEIIPDKKPGDPSNRGNGSFVFQKDNDSGVMTLNLPIGTENTPEEVRKIIEIPPTSESTTSEMGKQRFYNKADLVVIVYHKTNVVVRGQTTNITWSSISNFVNLDKTFTDQRENKTMQVTEIDVSKLIAWNNAGNPIKTALGRDVSSIYVADQRAQSSSTKPGVRLVNGGTLPSLGLTVATPDPLYVMGDFNASDSSLKSHNTSNTKPAAFIADSINVLSGSWNDSNSAKSISSRTASVTTVNAAFMAGIVETGNGYYSGGVENYPRFLENWDKKKFWYNGSMIVLYKSTIANSHWPGTGTVYNPPDRDWSFDSNFLDPNKLPPLCPSVRTIIRGQWAAVAP